jgi:predicted enzyme related to lactoylglutathione lyase
MATVNIRYIVNDVSAATAFYTTDLGFAVERQPAPGFAILSRGELRLLLSASTGPGGAAQPMPDGRKPEPGGWNRIQLEVDDLASKVEALRKVAPVSATTSSPVSVANKSFSTILPAIQSNSSNLHGDEVDVSGGSSP